MAKPPKSGPAPAPKAPSLAAENEPHGGAQPQEPSNDATDTPQPDINADTESAAAACPGAAAASEPDTPAADPGPAADDPAQLTDSAGEPDQPPCAILPDDRVPLRFTGPWKNYSRGDITRLPPDEAGLVIKKGLAEAGEE